MLTKKQTMSITLIILLLLINSGCMFPEETTFTMLSKAIMDDQGFPSLALHFKADDIIKANLIDPDRQVAFTDSFYSSESEILIQLTSYQNNPRPGVYKFQVYDKNDKQIYNETFSFNGINLTIISFNGYWWKENIEDSKYSLIGITLTVTNKGDLPAYPYYLEFSIDNKSTSANIIPVVVLPGETRPINCSIYIDNLEDYEYNCNVSVYDKNGGRLANSTFLVIPQENISVNHFSWDYNGKKEISIPFPSFLYEYYSKLERLETNDYAAYVFDPYDELYLTLFIDSFFSIAGDIDEISKINFIASFVQNLEYGEDDPLNSLYEYPLYPIEVLSNQTCDCEDRAIFVGNVLMLMDYNVSLLSLPKHMAIGVHLNENLTDYDFYIDEYYYLETIDKNLVLGEVPLLYSKIAEEALIYPLTSRPILNHEWKNAEGLSVDGRLNFVKLKLIVENIGNTYAENISITGAFYSSNDVQYNQEKIKISYLQPQEKKQVSLKLNVPKGVSTIFKTKLYLDEELVEEKQSTTTFT